MPGTSRRYTRETINRARELYLQDKSAREIAKLLIPSVKEGHTTVTRWIKREHWDEEKRDIEEHQKALAHERFAGRILETAIEHYEVGRLAVQAVKLALRDYFVYDPVTGEVLGVKLNKFGTPIITPMAAATLMEKGAALQRLALGVNEGMPREELEATVGKGATIAVEEADPELLRELGNFLALKAGEVPERQAEVLVNDERRLVRGEGEGDAVPGALTLSVPEGEDTLRRVDDVDVARVAGAPIETPVGAAPARLEDQEVEAETLGGTLGHQVDATRPAGDDRDVPPESGDKGRD